MRRPQQPVVKEVTLLQDGGDGVRRNGRIFLAHDRLVDVGIEAHAGLGRSACSPCFCSDVEELLVDQRDAFVELVAFLGVLERAVEVVEDREEVLHRPAEGVALKKSAFSRSARLRKFSKSASVRR